MGLSTVGDGDDNTPIEHKLSLLPEHNFLTYLDFFGPKLVGD